MKLLLTILNLFILTLAYCQTDYHNGFKVGYKNGYCHDMGISCIEPIPPSAPSLKVGESINSFTDGYDRGFKMGSQDQLAKSSNLPNTGTRKRGYETAEARFVDFVTPTSDNNIADLYNKGEKWDYIGSLIEKSLESLVMDEAMFKHGLLSKEKYQLSSKYYKELQLLVKEINRNKLQILGKDFVYKGYVNRLNNFYLKVK